MNILYEQLSDYSKTLDQSDNQFQQTSDFIKSLFEIIDNLKFKEKDEKNIEQNIKSAIISIIINNQINKLINEEKINVDIEHLNHKINQSISDFNKRKNSYFWKIFRSIFNNASKQFFHFVSAFAAVHIFAEGFIDFKSSVDKSWNLSGAWDNFTQNYSSMTYFAKSAYSTIFFLGIISKITYKIPKWYFRNEERNLKIVNNTIYAEERDEDAYDEAIKFCIFLREKHEEINDSTNDTYLERQSTTHSVEENRIESTYQTNITMETDAKDAIQKDIENIISKNLKKIDKTEFSSFIDFISSTYKDLESKLLGQAKEKTWETNPSLTLTLASSLHRKLFNNH